jgi:PP-loop superfamily ATP-utilizing enzyme
MNKNTKVLAWFSGGVTSAVGVWLAIQIFGKENVTVIFIDTKNEDADTYRFKDDCEKWYGLKIESVTMIDNDSGYKTIKDVWRKFKSLNVATGAICSTELKRKARIETQKNYAEHLQVFGYEFMKKEMNRALSMFLNNPDSKPIFPLLMFGYDKPKCLSICIENGVEPPRSYGLGIS